MLQVFAIFFNGFAIVLGVDLEKYKKLIAVCFFCLTAVFALYSQNSSGVSSNNLTEESIILSDNSTNTSNGASSYKAPSTAGTFVRMIFALIIVVALIYGVLWFIKKKTNIVKTEDEYLRRAAYLNIAPGKTVEVITLIDKAYLIGVTEDNITLLAEINDKELINAMNLTADKRTNVKKPANFSEVLDMFLAKKNNQKNVFSDTEKTVDEIFKKRGES